MKLVGIDELSRGVRSVSLRPIYDCSADVGIKHLKLE